MSHFEKASLSWGRGHPCQLSPSQGPGRTPLPDLAGRLVKEMRLSGITSVDEANEFLKTFLPKYNRKFKKPAASKADLHRPALHSRNLDKILCIKEERTYGRFHVIYGSKLYQIEKATRQR